MASTLKSAKRVVIRIDPVPDVLDQSTLKPEINNVREASRYVTPNQVKTGGPPKSSLKTVKRRQSLLVVTTPQSPVNAALARRFSDPTHAEQDDSILHHQHTEIENVLEEEEVIPQHHQVLYDLLGSDKAESILNPKMEEPSKAKDDTSTGNGQRRKLPAVDTGLGADVLWSILKKESDKKLHKMDKRIPEEWKASYGAFLRDNINKNRPLVQRSFTHHTDVPELSKLLDKRYKDRVRKARHHTNVMFRSSENNKNKTTLLLNNNPVPDYNDREGRDTLQRYFIEVSCKESFFAPSDPVRLPEVRNSIGAVQTNERIRSRFDNLRFLTEDAARTRGTFYGKYYNIDMVKMVTDFPGYNVKLPPSMKERITVSAPVHDLTGIRSFSAHRRVFSQSSSHLKREPTWQPLTVGALMEYASTKHVLGLGEFRHGQNQRWQTVSSNG